MERRQCTAVQLIVGGRCTVLRLMVSAAEAKVYAVENRAITAMMKSKRNSATATRGSELCGMVFGDAGLCS